ncbi:hypothetical protein HaLaN_09868 [Haematococcus lacustris]|uniref:Uncharacterized protein n=1 Tax=Haematococcus lacustris TaxID=44745 RepID=A0A699YUR2_HAELA|nr:hypothetical protein HaLaN_09868 [Haematococcus lacustris]
MMKSRLQPALAAPVQGSRQPAPSRAGTEPALQQVWLQQPLVVEPRLREQFLIASPTPAYEQLLQLTRQLNKLAVEQQTQQQQMQAGQQAGAAAPREGEGERERLPPSWKAQPQQGLQGQQPCRANAEMEQLQQEQRQHHHHWYQLQQQEREKRQDTAPAAGTTASSLGGVLKRQQPQEEPVGPGTAASHLAPGLTSAFQHVASQLHVSHQPSTSAAKIAWSCGSS